MTMPITLAPPRSRFDLSHGSSTGVNGLSNRTRVTGLRNPSDSSGITAGTSSAMSTFQSNAQVRFEGINAGALSIDATGSYGVLAGRKGLHLVDLESPFALAATLHHQTKWDVNVVKCHPHESYYTHVASTSNHHTLIWNIDYVNGKSGAKSRQPLTATLRAHTRTVNDVSWSLMEPTILATASADTNTHIWDLRTPERPVQTLSAYTTSAVQVEWNRMDATSIATAHEGEVRVWDTRMSEKSPAVLITAHMQKIYGLSWHPQHMYELITCSEDKMVKCWNVTQPRVCQGSLTTGAPVWRAQYTPFGDGIVTACHRSDNALRLWRITRSNEETVHFDSVHAFNGHGDTVKSFEWRQHTSTGAFQLVSWAKDQELRLWRVDPQHLEACGVTSISSESVVPRLPSEELKESNSMSNTRTYDISSLKNDFIPLVVPTTAIPLSTTEYAIDKDFHPLPLYGFEHGFDRVGESSDSSETEEEEESKSTLIEDAPVRDDPHVVGASALPCPRIFGASFSGPNVLLIFDSRVILGAAWSTLPSQTLIPPLKKAFKPMTFPRTYLELLTLRDTRGLRKRNKRVNVLGSSTNLVGMSTGPTDLSDWHENDSIMDGDGMGGIRRAIKSPPSSYLEIPSSNELAVHGGSEYLKMYFSNDQFHLPVNHPDHRISGPPATTSGTGTGTTLSPRRTNSVTAPTERSHKRINDSTLADSISLRVLLLDLSILCGVSPLLTYGTCVQSISHSTERLDAGSRDLLTWMLKTAESQSFTSRTRARISQSLLRKSNEMPMIHPLSHRLKSILAANPGEGSNHSISNRCAQNARTARLAGRPDLRHVWSLFELSSAADLHCVHGKQGDIKVSTTRPWHDHPFGQRLVYKVLGMYEQTGDFPTLASIVCALQPPDKKTQSSVDSVTDQIMSERSRRDEEGTMQLTTTRRASTSTAAFAAMIGSPTVKVHFGRSTPDSIDMIPPVLRNARRSTSHSEVREPSSRGSKQANEVSLNKSVVREWPLPRTISPAEGGGMGETGGNTLGSSGWKAEFEKLENPFKTWSAGSSTRESSPRPLTQDIFRPPPPPTPSVSSVTSGSLPTTSRQGIESTTRRREGCEEVLDPHGRILLQVVERTQGQEYNLLSSDFMEEQRYDAYKHVYANVLYRYGAMNLRSEVLKTLDHPSNDDEDRALQLSVLCHSCQAPSDSLYCTSCHDFAVKCSICQLVVRGQTLFCMTCGHGGHEQHMKSWFEYDNACPTGCGCWCKHATVARNASAEGRQRRGKSLSF